MKARKTKKLSQKERMEPATKGYIEDQDFVTKEYLDQKLENYVTKEYLDKKIDVDLPRHIGAIIEDSNSKLQVIFEHFDSRTKELEKISNSYGYKFEEHENRISFLELMNSKRA